MDRYGFNENLSGFIHLSQSNEDIQNELNDDFSPGGDGENMTRQERIFWGLFYLYHKYIDKYYEINMNQKDRMMYIKNAKTIIDGLIHSRIFGTLDEDIQSDINEESRIINNTLQSEFRLVTSKIPKLVTTRSTTFLPVSGKVHSFRSLLFPCLFA